jgi:hypothetical protein
MYEHEFSAFVYPPMESGLAYADRSSKVAGMLLDSTDEMQQPAKRETLGPGGL